MRYVNSFERRLAAVSLCIDQQGPTDGALTPLFLATSPKIETENIRGKCECSTVHVCITGCCAFSCCKFDHSRRESFRWQTDYTPIAQQDAVHEDLDDPAIAKKLWSQSEKLVNAVLEDPDPDRYFVGKKSTKDDGRRSRIVPKAPSAGASDGVSTDGLCTEESKDHCGGGSSDGASTTTAGSTGPKSVVVSGPGKGDGGCLL